METVLCGRNVEVPQHFREHVADKLSRLERYDHKIVRMEVQLSHEPNPRQSKSCQRVEITGRGRGPVVRGEGCSADFYSALDQAVARLEARLRRAHDRRRVSHGRRVPVSVARATGTISVTEELEGTTGAATDLLEPADPATNGHSHGRDWGVDVPAAREPEDDVPPGDDAAEDGERRLGQVVRTKEHHAVPMSVDDALSQMELVGHDFFLFADAATGRPSVVYRRHGYDYGVIALA
ncbi:ribosome hibernation-promoting factor, HPF/YfiA family [Actinomycetospora chibensis]|uniref:Ribosome hibernation promoting factor n=1 Tax=Actinomycetospora chibensis TaxID=663606 RepID=A0ABV9RG62_9PSEU|nr:ribosome-associated translation inhibitor RaiA [Actinomycetospora chibensis]MDD7924875.1 ribosome-associated translation inhibitor RaiA [Actinomycetospora chibensis]